MIVGQRIRQLRLSRNLSQGDIEDRTGLLRCYTSRVENGHTVPSLETIEKLARALEIPLYRFFLDDEEKPTPILPIATRKSRNYDRKSETYVNRFLDLFPRMNESDRSLLLFLTLRMERRSSSRKV